MQPENLEKGFYFHYKRDPNGPVENNYIYEVTGIARHTEDKSFFVLYRPLYASTFMLPADFQARPLGMFFEEVTKDGKTMPRFQKITDPETIAKLEKIRDEMYK